MQIFNKQMAKTCFKRDTYSAIYIVIIIKYLSLHHNSMANDSTRIYKQTCFKTYCDNFILVITLGTTIINTISPGIIWGKWVRFPKFDLVFWLVSDGIMNMKQIPFSYMHNHFYRISIKFCSVLSKAYGHPK